MGAGRMGRRWRNAVAGLVGGFLAGLPVCSAAMAQEARWDTFLSPSGGPSTVIGSYANGCIAGARPLPSDGRSEEPKPELQPLMRTSYAVFCLKKKNTSSRRSPVPATAHIDDPSAHYFNKFCTHS